MFAPGARGAGGIRGAACLLSLLSVAGSGQGASDVASARYLVLPADQRRELPFDRVVLTLGPPSVPGDSAGAETPGRWWELDVRRATANGDEQTLFRIRARTSSSPLAAPLARRHFARYRLAVPGTGDVLEYRSARTGRALLPVWDTFLDGFLPRAARGTRWQNGFPRTCSLLGQVLSLQRVEQDTPAWQPWEGVRVLELDDELLVGTSRVVKDAEGHRLPQRPERHNYTYVRWSKADYEAMIAAGFNTFALVPGIEPWLRRQPVFYRRNAGGEPPLSYPADLYRSNYRGNVMYADEPACIMVGDKRVHTTLKWFSDATELLRKRIRARYLLGARAIWKELYDRGTSLGDLVFSQLDYAVWETRYETASYQLAAGFQGFVHEGRYDFADFYESERSFDEWVEASTGIARKHSAEEMLRYQFAFLRGAARHHGKDWGISIYGQADPALSPIAVRLAYDMGARYVWFWTSDHGHHLPFGEQLELARALRDHAVAKPRGSIRGPLPTLDAVITAPWGELVVLESPTGRKNAWDLWWVRELDAAGRNDSSRRYRQRLQRVMREVHRALDAGEEFDIAVDDGRPFSGYRRVVRLK